MRVTRSIAALMCAWLLAGCTAPQTAAPSDGRIAVATSISTFNSIVEAVGGKRVSVKSLVPIGASPETYQPTPQDVATLSRADLLIENGAGLESWLAKTIANVGSSKLRTVVCSDGLPVQEGNPHLWMDPVFAQHYTIVIRDALMKLDPAHGEEYRTNARRYLGALADLRKSIARRVGMIPADRRVMIIQHNAFTYYNDRFGIKTLGVIEVNPGQDPNPAQLAHLVQLANQYHVRAVFAEPEYSTKLAEQLAHSSNVKVVDTLYDDSIGTDPRVATYIAMLNYDTDVIVRALR